MPNVRISELPEATAIAADTELPVRQATATRKATAAQLAGFSRLVPSTVQIEGSYPLTAADAGSVLRGVASATQTYTVPAEATEPIPEGAVITLRQLSTGKLKASAAPGVLLNVPAGFGAITDGPMKSIQLHKVGPDEWDVFGDLGPPIASEFIQAYGTASISPSNPAVANSDGPGTFSNSGGAYASGKNTGRLYFEFLSSTISNANDDTVLGLIQDFYFTSYDPLDDDLPTGVWQGAQLYSNRVLRSDGSLITSSFPTFSPSSVIGFAVDIDAGRYWISVNGTWYTGNPATNTGGGSFTVYAGQFLHPFAQFYAASLAAQIKTIAAEFEFGPPATFAGWDD